MTFMLRRIGRILGVSAMIALPVVAAFTGGAALVPFLTMPLIVLGAPMVLGVGRFGETDPEADADAEDEGGSDDGGGGNRRPDRGPAAPSGPMGELPLEFSRRPAGARAVTAANAPRIRATAAIPTRRPESRTGARACAEPPERGPAAPQRCGGFPCARR